MKTKHITILLVFFMIAGFQDIYSQTKVSYGYDAAGNRVSRTIVITQLKSAPAPEQEEHTTVYSEMLSGIKLDIYPNPTDGLLKVEIHNLPEGQTAGIMLYNLSGQLILTKKGIEKSAEIDISNQQAGTYLMKIVAGEYQTEWKIIKK